MSARQRNLTLTKEAEMDNFIITKMDETMINACVDLFIDTFTRPPWNDVYESREQVSDFFRNHLVNNYFLGYVLLVDSEIKGLSLGMKKPWIQGLEYYIDEFCIQHSLQGKGIGSRFMRAIEVEVKQEGLNGIILLTDKETPAFKFYMDNGFQELEGLVVVGK